MAKRNIIFSKQHYRDKKINKVERNIEKQVDKIIPVKKHPSYCVNIQIYPHELNNLEKISLYRCLDVFSKKNIDIYLSISIEGKEFAKNLLAKLKEKYSIKPHYMNCHNNYEDFHRYRETIEYNIFFINYDYLIEYQLDCYVFNGNIEYLLDMGYDYYAPQWYDEFSIKNYVGCDGVSINKIKTMIEISKYENEFNCYITDKFKIKYLDALCYKKCSAEIADKFAFNTKPWDSIKRTNGKLPHFCHWWNRSDYYIDFWKKYIDINE